MTSRGLATPLTDECLVLDGVEGGDAGTAVSSSSLLAPLTWEPLKYRVEY